MDTIWTLIIELIEASQRNYANVSLPVVISDEKGNLYELAGSGEAQLELDEKPTKVITLVFGEKLKDALREELRNAGVLVEMMANGATHDAVKPRLDRLRAVLRALTDEGAP